MKIRKLTDKQRLVRRIRDRKNEFIRLKDITGEMIEKNPTDTNLQSMYTAYKIVVREYSQLEEFARL